MEKFTELLSLKEASTISGYHSDYLSYLIRNGKLQGKKMGKSWVTTREDLDRYISTARFVPVKVLVSQLFSLKVLLGLAILVIAILSFLLYKRSSVPTAPASSASSTTSSDGGSIEIDKDFQYQNLSP